MIERFPRQLKASLMLYLDLSWIETLLGVLLGIHIVFTKDLQSLSAELVYGEPLRIPGNLLLLPSSSQSTHMLLLTNL
ncbi:hypothetical protein TNCT_205341 [Trichonephila clavata]|uniref:Uncharacterized protein n=1 Tax=Trichonephila clavata TaxID=2740835 RepID=A0A8X6LV13_TRICU|nr:hypothetical protein TNCT_205341 [Trichonephila clavata]